ncbi:MAG TPA: prolyl oligopeptidase family serine peptidase [Candidatus Lachnoclostridium pullistercoris]|uniref:Prolyl oligopeptidase family serine peptidase n=1 Tax=Candidatus Lachnoclostridium pullistercoris TaxID=2838632 RepID=A0A9D2PBH1_9FIRM|nr:prolyl oligopeptidase family serine peptidase [Candidatus Lachnoclostridium pullistercoris]
MKDQVKAQALPDAESLTIDPEHYYRQVLHGYYQFDCTVKEGVVRSAKFYIPENTVFNQPTVFVTVPDGEESWEFLVKSGWKQMADVRQLCIVLMEPENGAWSDEEADIAYITALNEDVGFRPFFCAFSSNFYGVAYGTAADAFGKQARRFPKCWAGAALLGSLGMTEDEKETLEKTETKVPGVAFSQVQMPVWIAAGEKMEDVERELTFYRAANHSDGVRQDGGCEIWDPKKGGTVDEHWCAEVVFDRRKWEDCLGFDYDCRIYDTVFAGVYRYPGNGNGALRKNADIRSRGFQKFSEKVAGGYYEDGRDAYRREWWVYLPESADRTKPVPAVFVFHGAGGSCDEIADRSGWAYVAEKYGFLIICPGASVPNRVRRVSNMVTNEMFRSMWNTGNPQKERPADMLFLDYLYSWLTEHYNVDRSRIYASGQSSGGMMSWACAAYRPDYFAATAPVSAKCIDIESEHPNPPVDGSIIPVMTNLGLEDRAFQGGYATEDAKELVDHWCSRFHLEPGWDGYTYADGGKHCSFQDGLFTNYLFRTKDGVPILRCVETATKAHAIWPSECEMAWTQWFSKFSKDPETKELYYEGKKVEI